MKAERGGLINLTRKFGKNDFMHQWIVWLKVNYKSDGRRYRLFSSGIDGLPDTKDDLYAEFK